MILSFLEKTFIQPNVRSVSQPELASKLADHLYAIRELVGEEAYPKRAEQYLDEWVSDEKAWLRKYYPPGEDEAHFDLTPATERVIEWVSSFHPRPFISTESRLRMVFELLRQIVEGTEADPDVRIAELKRKKAVIEKEIRQMQAGYIPLLDDSQVRDRFLQVETMARGLLADFRQVEQNFRALDRAARERVATFEGGKGALLEEILSQREAIVNSDQGNSFRAFWDFLMSPARQEELSALLEEVFHLGAILELAPDRRLRRIHYDWLAAGEVTQRTVARLSEQLRRYLDDQAWLENRRIMQLIRSVELRAIDLRAQPPQGTFMELDNAAPQIDLPMERPLYSPPFKPLVAQHSVVEGDESLPADALFDQVYVDKALLLARIRQALQARHQISIADLVKEWPLEQGVAELVAYLSLAADDDAAVIDDSRKQTLWWTDKSGVERRATLPLAIFSREVGLRTA